MNLKFVSGTDFFSVYSNISENEAAEASEYINAEYDFSDFEVLYGYSSGCLIFRYYSDEAGYHFDAPFALCENCDMAKAFFAISEYCKAEGIPETVVGIEPEYKDYMLRGAKKYSVAEDEDGTFAIRIYTECMTCESLPEVMIDNVYLGEFAFSYAEKYEKLIRNVNLNIHFGYNILDDIPDGSGEDFIKAVRDEFERGEAMTFAATVLEADKNVFVGEGTLYAFDGRGGASISFRVLPDWHRMGIGKKIFLGLIKIAKELRLERIYADVKNENLASLALLQKYMRLSSKNEEKTSFVIDLE